MRNRNFGYVDNIGPDQPVHMHNLIRSEHVKSDQNFLLFFLYIPQHQLSMYISGVAKMELFL